MRDLEGAVALVEAELPRPRDRVGYPLQTRTANSNPASPRRRRSHSRSLSNPGPLYAPVPRPAISARWRRSSDASNPIASIASRLSFMYARHTS